MFYPVQRVGGGATKQNGVGGKSSFTSTKGGRGRAKSFGHAERGAQKVLRKF